MNKALLANLHEITEFVQLLQELKKLRPIVPAYDFKDPDSVEKIKFYSAQQQEFDKLMFYINPFGEQQ